MVVLERMAHPARCAASNGAASGPGGERMLHRKRGTTRQGSTPVWTRACSIAQQPASWVGIAGVLATLGGRRGRRAAWRGLASYTAAALAANVVMKPLVRRRRPPEAGGGVGRITSSFPSGHSATEVAFALGAAQRP